MGSVRMLGAAYPTETESKSGGSALNLAATCSGETASQSTLAAYFSYSANPGTLPYDPATNGGVCRPGDTQGRPVVPAPALPDPGFLTPSPWAYSAPRDFTDRGTCTEIAPGSYNNFLLPACTARYLLHA